MGDLKQKKKRGWKELGKWKKRKGQKQEKDVVEDFDSGWNELQGGGVKQAGTQTGATCK